MVYTPVNYQPPRSVLQPYHPDIDASYKAKKAVPTGHPKVHALFAADMPASHPNLDTLLANPGAHPMPSWHPAVNPYVEWAEFSTVCTLPLYHIGIDEAYGITPLPVFFFNAIKHSEYCVQHSVICCFFSFEVLT